MNEWTPFIPWIGTAFGAGCLLSSLASNKRKRLIDNLPTSKTSGVFIGLVELKGRARCEAPLVSFLAEVACVHYAWQVQEHWSRTVTESYTDAQGRRQTRTRRESGWTTVASGGEMISFYLQDDHGVVQVRPEGAKIEPATVFSQECRRSDPLYYGKGPSHSVANSDHRRRFTETAILPGAQLYVMGQARERQDIVAPEIAADERAPMFLISTREESQISRGYAWKFWLWGILGLILTVGGWIIAISDGWGASFGISAAKGESYAIAGVAVGLLYFGASALGWLWMAFNSMVELRQRVRQGWAQIDVQLKRRHDLIPNLMAAVKGLSAHERELQEDLARLRTQLEATPPGHAGPDYSGCSRTLVAVAEKYPELKAQDAFLKLQKELADTESRIALARGYFNEIASHYNARLEVFPDCFVARLGRMERQPLFEAAEFERAAVEVHFDEQPLAESHSEA